MSQREESAGRVYLIGSSTGGWTYLTHRALEVLPQADVIITDDLVDDRILNQLSPQAEVIPVGKRGGQPSTSQDAINQLLIAKAQQGLQVVRLKSGDPLIFGRAVAELDALHQAHCAVEVIPGLSSALAGPSWAGIPLTHKTLSRCFAVFTGHDLTQLPWDALAQLDTLVILMGSRTLADISTHLMQSGRAPDTPMAVIHKAGSPDQQCWTGSLHALPRQLALRSLSPAIVVVGHCVSLRETLPPFLPLPDPVPLVGQTILVTRSETQATTFTELLQAQGARVLEMPTLEIVPPSNWAPLDQAILSLSTFTGLLLTSANAVTYFFERLHHHGYDSRALHGLYIAVVGSKTAHVLAQYGIHPDLMPQNFVAEALLDTWPQSGSAQRYLFPRVESGGRDQLVNGLRELGVEVVEVAAYQSQCPQQGNPRILRALRERHIDILTFASSKTVDHFHRLLQQDRLDLQSLGSLLIAAIGPKTAETCLTIFGRVDIMPETYTLEALTTAIVTHVVASRSI